MASASSGAAVFSRLVPDPALQLRIVTAFFGHLLTLPAPLPAAAHDGISYLLASPHAAVVAHASASLALLAAAHADLLAPDHALMFLIPPLSASPSPRLASCLVKAVAALVSCVLLSGWRFPPHNHPFVQALASGADGARAELSRQAARMVVEGAGGVVGFLRPFVMFAVVRKGDAAFVRDLIGALAAAATAAAKPDAAVPVLKLLGESLVHFGRRDGEEGRLWLSSVECLVDAYVILLDLGEADTMKEERIVLRSPMANAVAECCWLRQLLGELLCPISKATVVFCDNVSAYLSANPVHHGRTKHNSFFLH